MCCNGKRGDRADRRSCPHAAPSPAQHPASSVRPPSDIRNVERRLQPGYDPQAGERAVDGIMSLSCVSTQTASVYWPARSRTYATTAPSTRPRSRHATSNRRKPLRRRRDLNPRSLSRRSLSRRVHSAALPRLQANESTRRAGALVEGWCRVSRRRCRSRGLPA